MSRTNDRIYKQNRVRLLADPNLTCVICGQPIDRTLPQYDPMAFHADHAVAIGAGGDNRGDLIPTHRICNQRKGTRPLESVRFNPHSRQHY